MIELPNVTLIIAGDGSPENLYAWERSQKEIQFGATHWLPALPTYEAYNEFVIRKLHKQFKTSHCLLIQADGFVWNPSQWRSEFLTYDYIGAVMWNGVVGNGGFSLRSKRFCEETAKLPEVESTAPAGFETKDKVNEDARVCITHRARLETAGMKFAYPEVADKFSWELSDYRPNPLYSFGLHGKHTIERLNFMGALL